MAKWQLLLSFKNCIYISNFFHLSPSLKITKHLPFTCPFSLPSLLLSPQSSFLKAESTLTICSSDITHSQSMWIRVMLHDSMETSFGGEAQHFSFVCHWHWPLLNMPSALSLGFWAFWTSFSYSDHSSSFLTPCPKAGQPQVLSMTYFYTCCIHSL